MKPDRRDMPKIIVVAVLGALFLGCVVYQMVGKGASAAQPTPVPSKKVAKVWQPIPAAGVTTDANAKAEPKAQAPKSEAKPVQVALALPANRRDPFAPCITPQEFQPPSTPTPMPRVNGLKPLPNLGTGSLPPLVPPGANTLSISPTGTAIAADVTPKFVLTGVINGNTRVAIIRVDSERYIVREGQMINGKYFVRSVGRDGVLLTHGSQRIYLKLGGAANAS
jgi:hypothetical protein